MRAHQCFVFSCSLQGSTLVLNVVKSRVKVCSPSLFFPRLLVHIIMCITGVRKSRRVQASREIIDRHAMLPRVAVLA